MHKDKDRRFICIAACAMLACGFAMSAQYMQSGNFHFGATFLVVLALYFCFFYALYAIIRFNIEKWATLELDSKLFRVFEFKSKKDILILWAVMFMAWLPIIVALYPGTFSNDTTWQLSMYLGGIVDGNPKVTVSDHHPIFDTVLFGVFFTVMDSLLGNYRRAAFVYVILQALITAFVFVISIAYMKKLNLGSRWRLVAFLFYCFCPLFPIWTANLSKDSLFSWLFVLFLMCNIEIVRSRGAVLRKRSALMAVVIISILVSLTKKTGVYIVILSFLVLLFVFWKNNRVIRFISAPLAIVFIAMFVIHPLVLSSFGIVPGGKQEMLAVPLQQTARVVAMHGDDISPEEREDIDALLDYDTLADRYVYYNADSVKGYYELGTTEEYSEWAKTYLKLGIRHPLTYFDAFAALEAPWFSFTGISCLFDSSHHPASWPRYIPESTYSQTAFTSATATLVGNYYGAFSSLPGVNMIVSEGFYALIVPIFSLCLVVCRRGFAKESTSFAPVLLVLATLFISPVALGQEAARYVLPMVYTAPIVLSYAASTFRRCADMPRD